jgi:sulfatase modifying factor 1
MYWRNIMRKMRLILIFVAAAMLILTLVGCKDEKKPTEPDIDAPAGMVYVRGGTFTMGGTRDEDNEHIPPHKVTLSPFFIGKYEITQAEYTQFMPPVEEWVSDFGLGDNYPAYGISWYEVIKYCNLRSIAESLTPCYTINGSTNPADWGEVTAESLETWNAAICNFSANGYRMPTEAEWEYAARGATNKPDYLFSGSDDFQAVGWFADNNIGGTINPVGGKAPNGIGTYDMSGNVNEWCWDWFDETYYTNSPQNNPTGPESGILRVVRGGNWHFYSGVCYVSNRYHFDPGASSILNGFRVCRSKID